MKLNKLTSAVSVSLLAVALTACGSSKDDAPIIKPTTTTQPPTTTAPVVDNSAKLAQITANAKAAGLSDAAAAAFAAANVGLDIGSEAYQKALAEALAKQNAANNNGASDPTSAVVKTVNPFITGIDASKNATVTANQYVRHAGSEFDRRANPEQFGGLGEVGIDDPTSQNPYLSNYVLAVEAIPDGKGGKQRIAIDSTGELVKQDGNSQKGKRITDGKESPYAKSGGLYYRTAAQAGEREYHYGESGAANASETPEKHPAHARFKNSFVKAVFGGEANGTVGAGVANPSVVTLATDAAAGVAQAGKIYTIQEINKANTEVTSVHAENALKATKDGALTAATANAGLAGGQGHKSGLVVYNGKSVAAHGAEGYLVPVYGVEENAYFTRADGSIGIANARSKLVKENVAGADANDNTVSFEIVPSYTANAVTGVAQPAAGAENEFKENHGSAAFHKDFADAADANKKKDAYLKHATNVANNFETRVFGKNYQDYEAGKEGLQATDNTYVARFNTKDKLGSGKVATAKLHHVQYGRLTNNIDVLAVDTKKDPNNPVITYRQFQQHGAPNTVDTYFYRGTNHTTLDQMAALKARGGVVQYFGHALTYGVGPYVKKEVKREGLPTAYGDAGSADATIGNFVQAQYDMAGSTVTGSIYNFINKDVDNKPNDFTRQDLITFTGNVVGNTVIGTSANLATLEAGSLTASFYGAEANEIGGSVSYIPRELGYSAPKWGAVFGATKGTAIENFNVIEQAR